jgi:predicted TIM-barrel fold metal-dependent hydrolase
MDEHAIGASVLSLPGATSFLQGDDAKALARAMNEQFAEIIADHPHRFGAFAVLPMDDIEALLEETAYALDVLKLDGVTSEASSDGKYLGHAYYDQWLEELNRRKTTLFVHPGAPPRFEMADLGLNVSILEFMFESTRTVANMVISGAKERFSKINIISTHGGGTIPYLAARIELLEPLFELLEPLSGRRVMTDAEIQSGLSSFYYDLTAATSTPSLAALKKFISPTRLLMGFDFPMMPTTTIAPAQDQLAANGGFDDEATEAILFGNAQKLFPRLGKCSHAEPNSRKQAQATKCSQTPSALTSAAIEPVGNKRKAAKCQRHKIVATKRRRKRKTRAP